MLHFLLLLTFLFCSVFLLFWVVVVRRRTGSHVSKPGFQISTAKDELEPLSAFTSPVLGLRKCSTIPGFDALETKLRASYMLDQWNYIPALILAFLWFRLLIC